MTLTRSVLPLVIVALLGAGCVKSEVLPVPGPHPPETPVSLVLEPQAPRILIMESGPVAVRLTEVDDSRCPKDARCVQAGEGRVTLAIDGDGFGSYRLEISTVDEHAVYLNRLGCKLDRLDPYPRAGVPADSAAYRASVSFYGAALPEEEPQP